MRKRIEAWRNVQSERFPPWLDQLIVEARQPLPAVNGGVFAYTRDATLLRTWGNLPMRGETHLSAMKSPCSCCSHGSRTRYWTAALTVRRSMPRALPTSGCGTFTARSTSAERIAANYGGPRIASVWPKTSPSWRLGLPAATLVWQVTWQPLRRGRHETRIGQSLLALFSTAHLSTQFAVPLSPPIARGDDDSGPFDFGCQYGRCPRYFAGIPSPANVQLRPWSLADNLVTRRMIGRNLAALATEADWVWFTDCDYAFERDVWMGATWQPTAEQQLLFPRNAYQNRDHASGDRELDRVFHAPCVIACYALRVRAEAVQPGHRGHPGGARSTSPRIGTAAVPGSRTSRPPPGFPTRTIFGSDERWERREHRCWYRTSTAFAIASELGPCSTGLEVG